MDIRETSPGSPLVIVMGGTGYVGGRLLKALEARGLLAQTYRRVSIPRQSRGL